MISHDQDQHQHGIPSGLLEKARRFCAYQERCLQETRRKMRTLGASAEQSEMIAARMMEEGFIDEARFASAFARGKFFSRQWGRLRIRQELLLRRIPENLIDQSLNEIDQDKYVQCLHDMLEKKINGSRSPGSREEKIQRAMS